MPHLSELQDDDDDDAFGDTSSRLLALTMRQAQINDNWRLSLYSNSRRWHCHYFRLSKRKQGYEDSHLLVLIQLIVKKCLPSSDLGPEKDQSGLT